MDTNTQTEGTLMFGSVEHAEVVERAVTEAREWRDYVRALNDAVDDAEHVERGEVRGNGKWTYPGKEWAESSDFYFFLLPEGYKYLGEGGARKAFLAPDGYVYKVEPGDGNHQNASEANAYAALCHLFPSHVEGFRMAAVYRITDDVNVAEFISGEECGNEIPNEMIRAVYRVAGRAGWQVSDLCYDNARRDEAGNYVCVDHGCFYPTDSPYYV